MFFRARRAIARSWFNFNARDVLRTAPLILDRDDVSIVSMLCHGEALMYLLATKSFCRALGSVPNITILNDGSLEEEERTLLRKHIPHVEIVSISSVKPAACPKGSCWERLLLISDVVRNSFVVQLDADTLTAGDISEVQQCIEANRSFTLLGDRSYPRIESMQDACQRSKANSSAMVQGLCERSFDQLPESTSMKYVRGNAGFSGFARGSIDREQVVLFSDLMRRIAGETWDEWGSEQVTSNLLIANTEQAQPLTFPKYLSYWAHPDVPYEKASFIHFIGPHRFSNGFYMKRARQVIKALQK